MNLPQLNHENTFFVADMYKKFHFVEHPQTKKRYLSVLDEDNEKIISYDYLKVPDSFKTPSMYLKNKEYDKALLGYLNIQKQAVSQNYPLQQVYFPHLILLNMLKMIYTIFHNFLLKLLLMKTMLVQNLFVQLEN